ncbi:hypothetical protein T09_9487 [Trichinella sp. T9]|nr:hypothetical protein T09_9487 [Trichinella sp. T9]
MDENVTPLHYLIDSMKEASCKFSFVCSLTCCRLDVYEQREDVVGLLITFEHTINLISRCHTKISNITLSHKNYPMIMNYFLNWQYQNSSVETAKKYKITQCYISFETYDD